MRVPRPISQAFEFAAAVFREYGADRGSLVAAAVSFYVFLSLVPILLLAVAAFAFVTGSPERAQEVVLAKLQGAVTIGGESVQVVRGAVTEVVSARGVATGVSLLALLWTGTSTVTILEEAMNVAWNVRERRPFLTRRLVAVAMFVVIGALLAISVALSALVAAVRGADIEVLGVSPADIPLIWPFIGFALPLLVSIGAFSAIYKILPFTRVPLGTALLGGVFAGVLWEAAKWLFGYYVSTFADYSKVYGSLGGIILLTVWINYTAVITVLGAEVISVKEGRRTRSHVPES